jgi:hypothetical protein
MAQVVGEDSQIIQSKEMVRVFVGVDYGMDSRNPFAQQLHAEVRRRVDQQISFGKAQDNTAPSTLILRILVQACGTIATNHGHSVRGARAKQDKLISKNAFSEGGHVKFFFWEIMWFSSAKGPNTNPKR